MSSVSPLPLQPLPPSTLSEAESRALKQEVASRLAEHRKRRPRVAETQDTLPLLGRPVARNSRIASSVAARFSKSPSYRDLLQQEAQAAIHQAEAEAEVAQRTSDAIVAAQQGLLDEIEHWNATDPAAHETARALPSLVPERRPADAPSPLAVVEAMAVEATLQPTHVHVAAFIPTPELLEPAIPLPANLIEFPRQLVAARRARPRLAEGPLSMESDASPERAQLRIFEVEANSISTVPLSETALPEWHSIHLDAQELSLDAAYPESQVSFAMPLHVAPASLRAMATLVDGCCIMTALLLAIAMAAYASPVLPTGLPALIAAGTTLFVLWLFYQVLFFTLGDATPGMRYARIGLCTFADENPTRSSMQRRIGARLLAGMPLGLGLIWACLDDEGLGWHDRISRMYPREY